VANIFLGFPTSISASSSNFRKRIARNSNIQGGRCAYVCVAFPKKESATHTFLPVFPPFVCTASLYPSA
jgi:hypothetical protein